MENAERKIVLENAIAIYVQQGYRVVSQTENTVQLIKPKQFSLFIAIILLLFFILPFVIYLLYYLTQKEKAVYIVVNDGKITVTDEQGKVRVVDDIKKLPYSVVKSHKSIPAQNDPGYTKSTKVMIFILAVIVLAIILLSIYSPIGNA